MPFLGSTSSDKPKLVHPFLIHRRTVDSWTASIIRAASLAPIRRFENGRLVSRSRCNLKIFARHHMTQANASHRVKTLQKEY